MNQQNTEQPESVNWGRRIIALAGVLCITIGQYLLIGNPVDESKILPNHSWVIILGVGLLIISLFVPGQKTQVRLANLRISETGLGIFLSLLLSSLTILSLILFYSSGIANYLPVTLTWLASGFVYVLAFRDKTSIDFSLADWYREYKSELILVGSAFILAFVLRFYELGNLPRVIDGDEGLMGMFAESTRSGSLASPFALWENFGSSYLQLVNFLFETMGVSPFTLRLLPAISGVLAIPALYLFARQIVGIRVAIVAAFLLAFSHSHIHFSRIASVGYIHGTWLAPLELYLLLSGLEKKVSWRTAAAGVLLALHLQVYLTVQIILGLILVYMLISFLFLKDWFRPALKQAAVFWGGFIIVLMPQLYYIFRNPNEFFNRLSVDGTFQSGWLASTMANTGKSALEILAGRVSHAFLSLIYYPAIDFYGSTIPLLSVFSAILFMIGLGIVLFRAKSPGYLMLNGYFWAGTFAVGLFAIPPSADSYRMLITLPPAFVMAAVGLDQLLNIAGLEWERTKRAYIFSMAGILFAMLIMGVSMYYYEFAGKCRYGGGLVGRFASYMGVYANTVDENSDIYLLSDTEYFYGSHASADFLSEHRTITNYPEPMDSYEVKFGETLIASPSRMDELLAWARAHPGGELTRLYDCETAILLSYQIPERTFEP